MATSPFYVYIKNVKDDCTWRYVAVFATRAVADEWWRAVSTSSNTKFASSVQRVTPQFYTHNPSVANVAHSITDAAVAKQFLGSVIFTLLHDRDGRVLSLIPPLDVTDHISGKTFYIRAQGDKSVYWYCAPDGRVVASRTRSTRFVVRAADSALAGKVMIHSDLIQITCGSDHRALSVAQSGQLQAAGRAERLLFGDFIDGFAVDVDAFVVDNQWTGTEAAVVKAHEGDGEPWELTLAGRIDLRGDRGAR